MHKIDQVLVAFESSPSLIGQIDKFPFLSVFITQGAESPDEWRLHFLLLFQTLCVCVL